MNLFKYIIDIRGDNPYNSYKLLSRLLKIDHKISFLQDFKCAFCFSKIYKNHAAKGTKIH